MSFTSHGFGDKSLKIAGTLGLPRRSLDEPESVDEPESFDEIPALSSVTSGLYADADREVGTLRGQSISLGQETPHPSVRQMFYRVPKVPSQTNDLSTAGRENLCARSVWIRLV